MCDKSVIEKFWSVLDASREVGEANKDWLDFMAFMIPFTPQSHSQLFQDLWVLWSSRLMTNGFFVEFGAGDGVKLSNTALLERSFEWKGILAEPNPIYHAELAANRSCRIDKRCIWSKSGEMQTLRAVSTPEFSRLDVSNPQDIHETNGRRDDWVPISVETVTLKDLLIAHSAPNVIDYLSIDTEGSEFEIVSAFDFARFDVRLITIEHNFTLMRQQIHDFLSTRGYVRSFEKWTKWDDWYFKT